MTIQNRIYQSLIKGLQESPEDTSTPEVMTEEQQKELYNLLSEMNGEQLMEWYGRMFAQQLSEDNYPNWIPRPGPGNWTTPKPVRHKFSDPWNKWEYWFPYYPGHEEGPTDDDEDYTDPDDYPYYDWEQEEMVPGRKPRRVFPEIVPDDEGPPEEHEIEPENPIVIPYRPGMQPKPEIPSVPRPVDPARPDRVTPNTPTTPTIPGGPSGIPGIPINLPKRLKFLEPIFQKVM